MNTVFMTPQQHDDAGGISHMPHSGFCFASFTEGLHKNSKDIIGTGFKSMTRIGASGEMFAGSFTRIKSRS